MFNIFGTRSQEQKRKAATPAANSARTMEALKKATEREAALEKKIKFLQQKKDALHAQAKAKLAAGDKTGAKHILKRKAMLDSQLAQVEGALGKSMLMRGALEQSNMTQQVAHGMRSAQQALAQANAGINPDEIADIMDSAQEQVEAVQSASDALSMPMPGEMDEFDMEDALAELDDDIAADQAKVAAPTAAPLPPTAAMPAATTQASTATAATTSTTGAAEAAALPQAPSASLPAAATAATPGTAVPAGAGGAGGGGESEDMDDELRMLEASMAM